MDFNGHEEQEEHQVDAEEEDELPTVQPPLQGGGYPDTLDLSGGGDGGASGRRKPSGFLRYRECLKNHAVGIGGNALDGCCEFMAAGEEGTLDGLRCAACGCHRNFHRKETALSASGGAGGGILYHSHLHHQYSPYFRAAPSPAGYLHLTAPGHQLQARPLALPSTSREDLEDVSNPSSSGGGGGGRRSCGLMRKRCRTKFTAEQKEKMMGFAERLGWRIQKHDEATVEEFCSETGLRRQVLKVWMHNNKHAHGKKP